MMKDNSETHNAGRGYIDDLNLTSFHENAIVHLTGEVSDPLNRPIVLSDRIGKFDANPLAWREGRCTAKANDSAAERNINDGANGEVDGG
jgi:hypothetical protein